MTNIIKMDLTRILKSTFVYVLLIISAAYLLLSAKMIQFTFDEMKTNADSYQEIMMQDPEISAELDVNFQYALGTEEYRFFDHAASMLNNDLLVFIAIFAAIFVNAQQKNGYIKSIAQLAPKRGRFTISNAISVAIAVFAYYIFIFLISLLGYILFFGTPSFAGFSEYIAVFLLKLLLFISFSMMILMFATVMRSSGLSITAGIIISTGIVSNLLFGLIDMVLHKFLNITEKFSISNYTITQNIYSLSTQSSNKELLRAGIVGAAFIIVSLFIAIAVMNKRDVK